MKAIVIHDYGPPDVLRYEDVPDPVPRQGEIRIKVHAATVNRVLDVSLRAGREQYRGPVLPLIPGVDCAGVVDTVGPQVSRWRVGDRVSAAGIMPLQISAEDGSGYDGPQGMMGIKRPGGFAELVAVPACAGVAIPQNLDFHRAAVVMRHVPTAWNLLMHVAELKRGETVLIMGAGGNLGSDEVMKITAGKGVDVLYDNIANPAVLPIAFRAIGMDGRLVTAGAHAGPNVSIDFSHLYHKRITIKGRPGFTPADLPHCLEAAAQGKVIPQIERVLPLSRAADAHRMVEAHEGQGKIVLDPTLG